MRVTKRVVLVLLVAGAWSGAGSALLVSPAAAEGGVDDDGNIWGQVNNLTPYKWTFVKARAPSSRDCGASDKYGWFDNSAGQRFFDTVMPGQALVYTLIPCWRETLGLDYRLRDHYSGWFTYKVEAVGRPEYITIAITHTYLPGANYIEEHPGICVYNTTEPPPDDYDPASCPNVPVPQTFGPQVGWTQSDAIGSDVTFQVTGGDFTIDASTDPPQLVSLLDGLCDSAVGTTCIFTASGPTEWGVGTAVEQPTARNCVEGVDPGEASGEPGWFDLTYTAEQSASLTVGGGVNVSTEVNLFNIIKSEVSLEVEAEHDWGQSKSTKRGLRVYIPANNIAEAWVAPTEAKIPGTLVATTNVAKYTITNFGAKQSGIQRDDSTADFSSIVRTRPMTADELQKFCNIKAATAVKSRASTGKWSPPSPAGAGDRGGTARGAVAPKRVPPTPGRLVPGQGVAAVKLGQTEAQVERRLGQPLFKSSTAVDCPVIDPRCNAPGAGRGTWVYRQANVVFGADRRVHTLIYRGSGKTAKGAGVGISKAAVRAAHPRARCTQYVAHTNCTLKRTHKRRPVKTVFHFTHNTRGPRTVDRVMIHYGTGTRRGVKS
jgi:hypothetical protein